MAATNTASRVAVEFGTEIGSLVGYRIGRTLSQGVYEKEREGGRECVCAHVCVCKSACIIPADIYREKAIMERQHIGEHYIYIIEL